MIVVSCWLCVFVLMVLSLIVIWSLLSPSLLGRGCGIFWFLHWSLAFIICWSLSVRSGGNQSICFSVDVQDGVAEVPFNIWNRVQIWVDYGIIQQAFQLLGCDIVLHLHDI